MAIESPPTCSSPLQLEYRQTGSFPISDEALSSHTLLLTSLFFFQTIVPQKSLLDQSRSVAPTSVRMTSPGNFWSQSGMTQKVPRNLVDGIRGLFVSLYLYCCPHWVCSQIILLLWHLIFIFLINVRIVTSHTDVYFVLWVACSTWGILVYFYYARFGFEDLSLSPIPNLYPVSPFILFFNLIFKKLKQSFFIFHINPSYRSLPSFLSLLPLLPLHPFSPQRG